ncbi:hypothetical protein ACFV0D_21800 [Streptomyces sp. NPDC059556]|uniref:hypothetical protein n=1 Tax=Streptomyces sp. NPDC059556 TaxID=3346863 RepID=UPI0036755FFD
MDTLRSESSAWSYRYERNAIVVTVPMTAATTAISATAETTSRVRSDHGRRVREVGVRDVGVRDDGVREVGVRDDGVVGDDGVREDGVVGDDGVREDGVRDGRVSGRRIRDDRVGDGRFRCPAPRTTGRYSPGLMR